MSVRDQPYLPLYVQDFLTDEKLNECSAASTGVYIRLMCVMHKSENYGKVLLKQKDKQSDEQILNFATKVAKSLPYKEEVVYAALKELLEEEVLFIDGDALVQKRMVKDYEISYQRTLSGKKGGDASKRNREFAKAKTIANCVANSDNDNDSVIDTKNNKEEEVLGIEKVRFKIDSPLKFPNWRKDCISFFLDEKWKDKFCQSKKISLGQLEKVMVDFIINSDLQSKYKADVPGIIAHFLNSYNKRFADGFYEINNKNLRQGTETFTQVPSEEDYENMITWPDKS